MKKQLFIFLLLTLSCANSIVGQTATSGNNASGSENTIVGKTADEMTVNANGQFSYEIPIAVVPGTGGMIPNLYIAYSSSNGNGLFGYGFDLKGLSLISRMPKNLFRDGKADVIRFDSSDRFALDGMRMSLVNTTDGVREYRTETNVYSKIISTGTSDNPSMFIVYSKDGIIHEYTSAKTMFGSSGNNLYWLETKVSDTKGNYYTITYGGDAGTNEFYPTQIDYTGNASAALSPYASVRFSYQSASVRTSYISGEKVCRSRVISSISCYYGNNLVRKYSVSYSSVNGNYYVSKISETAGNEKKNPTSFTWNNNGSISVLCAISSTDSSFKNKYIVTGDFNGDGKTDFLARANNNTKNYDYNIYVSNGNSFKSPVSGQFVIPQNAKPNYKNICQVQSGDFNGDGYDDLVVERANSPFYAIDLYLTHIDDNATVSIDYEKTIVLSISFNHDIMVMDNNCDGVADLFLRNSNEGSTSYYVLMSQSSENGVIPLSQQFNGDISNDTWEMLYPTILLDLDGDGTKEVLNIHESNNSCLYSILPTGELKRETWLSLKGTDYFCTGDFNGDGKSDILTMGSTSNENANWEVNFSTGVYSGTTGLFQAYTLSKLFSAKDKQVYVVDINGDGYDDLYVTDKNGDNNKKPINIFINKGDGKAFITYTGAEVYGSNKRRFTFGDFNGDGKTDFICNPKITDSTPGYDLYVVNNSDNNLLSSITDGLGNITNVSYTRLTDNAIHTRGNWTDYPLVSACCPWPVVSHVSKPNGIGGSHNVDYHYKNMILHKHGRGVLGFEQVTETDCTVGVETTKDYEVLGSERIPVLKRQKSAVNGRLLHEIENTYEITYQNRTNKSEYSFTCYPTHTIERSYEYNSGAMTSEIETTTSYDDCGNVKKNIVRNGLNTTTTTNTYSNDQTKWILGRLTRAEVTKEDADGGTVTTSSEFEYDSESGILTAERFEPGNPLGYEKTYTYDRFGNVLEDVISANDGGSEDRHTKTEYSSDGRFKIRSENSLGHVSTSIVDSRLGIETQSTDINGITATYEHNYFGEMSIAETPLERTSVTTEWAAGHSYAPEHSLFYVRTEATGTPTQWVFYDCLGRKVRHAVDGRDGKVIYTDVEYDNRGQVIRESEPYFRGETPYWNTMEYDAVGRIVKETKAGGGATTMTYEGLTTSVTDPLSHTSSKTYDLNGNLIQSTDAMGNSVRYKYDVNGKCVEVTGPRTTIKMEYDKLGNKTKLEDPDLGTIQYEYNSYGELISQTDSKGETTFEYDKAGRLIRECRPDYTYTHEYDTEWNGALTASACSNGMTHSYSYDNYGRVIGEQEVIDDNTFNTSYSYNGKNKLDVITYPSGFQVKNNYTNDGYLLSVTSNDSNSKAYWKAGNTNARGQLESEEFGNGVIVSTTYNTTGALTRTFASGLFDKTYTYDVVNNLQSRTDEIRSMTENFEYDELNRLTRAYDNRSHDQEVRYDDAGNITYKTGIGSLSYIDKTNKISSISCGAYMLPLWDAIDYSSFNKITHVKRDRSDVGSVIYDELFLSYGADKTRKVEKITTFKRRKSAGHPTGNYTTVLKHKYYVGNLYEKEVSDVDNKEINYIFAGGKAIAIFETSEVGDDIITYLHRDHLGSVMALTDECGYLDKELSYDAWGRRRSADTWDYYDNSVDSIAEYDRGFTGHEHIDKFDMVNMDGRMYDPVLGRFLSPDPYVQMPDFTQSLNRYAYCINSPLSLTDPSGYNWMGDLMATAVGVAVGLETCGLATGIYGAIIGGALGGASSSLVGAVLNGANLWQTTKNVFTGAFWGAASAAIDFQIGEINNVFKRIAVHSVSEGFVEGIRGGHFEHGLLVGFASSAGGELISRYGGSLPYAGQIAANAALGGFVSELGGGKFANGAMTAAYTMMFNELMHPKKSKMYDKRIILVTFPFDEKVGSGNASMIVDTYVFVEDNMQARTVDIHVMLTSHSIIPHVEIEGAFEVELQVGNKKYEYFFNKPTGAYVVPSGTNFTGDVYIRKVHYGNAISINLKVSGGWNYCSPGGRVPLTSPTIIGYFIPARYNYEFKVK